jgi:acetyl esterase/lipase
LAGGTTQRANANSVIGVDVHPDITYYVPSTPTVNGNKLDLYVPVTPGNRKVPLLIWSSGSAWLSDNGRDGAASIAEVFNPLGYAVAGVSVRSSAQAKFPGQLYDIRAAVRWLRDHAAEYRLDSKRFAIMGNSSGGWVTAIAGTTSDIAQLPGEPATGGTSSAVQAAVPFFPPTDFLQMDAWYVDHPDVVSFIRHDAPLTPLAPPWNFFNASPESLLVQCTDAGGNLLGIQACPAQTGAANPISYVNGDEVPMLILHGESDPLVPNGQSVLLYEALAGAGNEVTFVSVPAAGHSVDQIIGAAEFTVFQTNRGGKEKISTKPAPTWGNIEHFIRVALRRGG